MVLKKGLKRAGAAVLHRVGGYRLARWMHRDRLRILAYHRFNHLEDLEFQCRHLSRHCQPISLTEAAGFLRSGRPFPSNAVAVTVDDGYRDFLEMAYPVFSAFRIPVTVYVVTDFLDRKVWLWVDQIRFAFLMTRRTTFGIQLPAGCRFDFELRTEEQRRLAAQSLSDAMKLLDNRDRLSLMSQLPERLEVEIPPHPPAASSPLTWQEVRNLAARGVEFGAHTKTHPILSRVSSATDLMKEIAGAKHRIEQMLGCPTRHFSYPNGGRRDISNDAVDIVRQAGYLTAVTMQNGINSCRDDRLLLRRIGVEPGYDRQYFKKCTAALSP